MRGAKKNNCTAFRHNGREIYKARKEGAYAFRAVDEKYGERSITVLSSVKNPDYVRHWIARPFESLGLNAGCARAGERKAP